MLIMKRILILLLLITLLRGTSPVYAGEFPSLKSLKNFTHSRSLSFARKLQTHVSKLSQKNKPIRFNFRERKFQKALFKKARRATFRALPKEPSFANALTGTTFRVKYRGKSEIFGVVATHALQDIYVSSGMLGKEFNAVFTEGNVSRTIPAEVVQITPASMGDLALVKFPAEFEKFLHPLELENVELTFPVQGYSQGYAQNLLTKQAFPIVGKTSSGALTAQLPPAKLGDRSGFCGSPVFTANFQLAGIHVGSSYKTNIGYITPISVIQNLVKSYHDPKLKPQSIVLAGREIGRLAIDEYVASVELLDKHYRPLWKYSFRSKFSLSQAEKELAKQDNVAFVRLLVGRTMWIDEGARSYLVYDEMSQSRSILIPWNSQSTSK